MLLLCFLGILLFPIFTFGFVLIHFNHPLLGIFAIIISALKNKDEEKTIHVHRSLPKITDKNSKHKTC